MKSWQAKAEDIGSGFYNDASPDGLSKIFARLRVLRASALISIFPRPGFILVKIP